MFPYHQYVWPSICLSVYNSLYVCIHICMVHLQSGCVYTIYYVEMGWCVEEACSSVQSWLDESHIHSVYLLLSIHSVSGFIMVNLYTYSKGCFCCSGTVSSLGAIRRVQLKSRDSCGLKCVTKQRTFLSLLKPFSQS